ncbi:MAG: hypothetical protein D6734_07035 [Candidatus Schekmanbacteria bacterium]|nr:MAG: hypothetical protein D6734_07035 [Candidatus Schekmanbacteria bacterium]
MLFEKFKEKSIILLLIFLFLHLALGCTALKNDKDQWLSKDKAYHFLAAGAISASATAISKKGKLSDAESTLVGVSITLAAGTGKESYDKKIKKTFFSWKDMIFNLLGALTGSLIVNMTD